MGARSGGFQVVLQENIFMKKKPFFNAISSFVGYLIPCRKSVMILFNQYLKDGGIHRVPKGFSPKINVTV